MILCFPLQITETNTSNKRKLYIHFSDAWHLLDIAIFTLYFLSIGFRFYDKEINNLFMSLTAFFCILRFLKNLYGFKRLGPYIFMMNRMVSINLALEFEMLWDLRWYKPSVRSCFKLRNITK